MTKTIQLLRGTTAQNAAFTGASGEVTVDTQTHELRVHDGSTVGGHIIYTKSEVDTALSSKADAATTYTKSDVDTALSGKANVDMDNLTSTGQNIANWSSNVSNCITHIPQDIVITYTSSGITLKAGSKLYVPNGADNYDEITIAADVTSSSTGSDGEYLMCYNPTGGYISKSKVNEYLSSDTQPTLLDYWFWYDTINNAIKRYLSGALQPDLYTLPFARIIISNNAIVQVEQIFNGFGFIGSLVFMLPGVKMLIPNGRNADGSLKNIEWEADTVYKTNYRNWVSTGNQAVQMGPSVNNIWDRYVQTEYMPATNTYTLWYKPSENVLRVNNTGNNYTSEDQWTITTGGIYITSIGPGTNIDPIYYKQPGVCHVLDYQNTEYMCNQSTPSGVAINLTPANNTYYKAPADGWFVAIGSGTGTNMWLELTSDIAQGVYGTVGWQYKVCLAVKKGASCELTFNNINFATFKFVYANGAIGWK